MQINNVRYVLQDGFYPVLEMELDGKQVSIPGEPKLAWFDNQAVYVGLEDELPPIKLKNGKELRGFVQDDAVWSEFTKFMNAVKSGDRSNFSVQ